jgi:hypothetical protein
MKIHNKTKKIILPGTAGVLLAAYNIYTVSGKFGLQELIIVFITALVVLGIILLINKMVSKK